MLSPWIKTPTIGQQYDKERLYEIKMIESGNLTRYNMGTNMDSIHPASRVTLWVSHGKFASRTSFQGGLFFFRGAIFFLQGGLFFWHEKWKFTFRGALAPLKENCILSSKLVI